MARKPKIQCRIERDTDAAIGAYQDGLAEEIDKSESVRHLLRAGLAAKGHPVAATDGGTRPPRLAVAGERLGWVFAIIGLAWVGVTLAYPVSVRLPAIGALLASVAAFGVARGVERYDLRLTKLGRRVRGGESG